MATVGELLVQVASKNINSEFIGELATIFLITNITFNSHI